MVTTGRSVDIVRRCTSSAAVEDVTGFLMVRDVKQWNLSMKDTLGKPFCPL